MQNRISLIKVKFYSTVHLKSNCCQVWILKWDRIWKQHCTHTIITQTTIAQHASKKFTHFLDYNKKFFFFFKLKCKQLRANYLRVFSKICACLLSVVVALHLEYFILKGRKLLYVATEMLNVAETKKKNTHTHTQTDHVIFIYNGKKITSILVGLCYTNLFK
jgi:hypothetical protein